VTAKSDYVPALLNLGNIAFMREDFARASELYSRAERQDPDNATVNLALARIAYQKDDFKAAQERFAKLEKENPELAAQFSYLGAGAGGSERAASVEDRNAAVWGEE
jgi:Tfp pilus assembly protein PilF